jgi:tetraprenyl-beta-curcumene synthase
MQKALAGRRLALATTFAGAARRYWLSVFPSLGSEVRRWQSRASEIRDPVLRRLALDSQQAKRKSLEGAVAFAAFVPRGGRRPVIRALTAYQVIFDYLDTLSEQPNTDPIVNGRQLNQALLTAVGPHSASLDYYAHHSHRNDDGYLDDLVKVCRATLGTLPSYAATAAAVRRATERIVAYQSLNHGDAHGSHAAFASWAIEETRPDTGLRWWETGAAAGSSLAVLALITAAADPLLTTEQTAALENAYYPWIGALHTLLDSLIDRQEDTTAAGHRSLIDCYLSPVETAARLEMIAAQAVRHARSLPRANNHAMILAAMASLYLSDPQASMPGAQLAKRRVLATMGDLAAPTMLVMGARRAASQLVRATRVRTPPERHRTPPELNDLVVSDKGLHLDRDATFE